MPTSIVESVGRRANRQLAAFGDFCVFSGQVFRGIPTIFTPRALARLLPQLYEVGTRSVPVIGVTGAFIGMVLAVETYGQFKSIGLVTRLGSVINLSVVKQIGPVLASVMLAGRVGGALTAELGTMNVTEQLDALRVMGSEPIRYLVVPRFIACVLLTPTLTIYSDMLGVIGGWLVAVKFLGVPNGPYWDYARQGVDMWNVMEGIVKAFFFGGAIGLVSCYKGFNCGSGAGGVGRACTDSFVTSFLCIIVLNFFFAKFLQDMYHTIYGMRGIFS
jgi:phospholipid/cholesterol/gamma-HCH transport system permease protein